MGKNASKEKLQHKKINLETVSMLNLGQLLTGLEVRYINLFIIYSVILNRS